MTIPQYNPAFPSPPPAKPSRALKWGVIIACLLLVFALVGDLIFGLLWMRQSNAADEARGQVASSQYEKRAEQVAMDYAVGSATLDYRDMAAWRSRLTANTSPELTKQLTQVAPTIEQIIVQTKTVATATPAAAAVRSEKNGVYVVAAAVNASTTNTQSPNGAESVAVYVVTVDKNAGWVITDVKGGKV